MTSVGIDQHTGKVLVGWPHVVQSIIKIVMTELGSRVERRDVGSRLISLLDKPQNEETMLQFFMAIAEALEPRIVRGSIYGEPRFSLTAISFNLSKPGVVPISLMGNYYPDGHKNTSSTPQPRDLVIEVPAASLT